MTKVRENAEKIFDALRAAGEVEAEGRARAGLVERDGDGVGNCGRRHCCDRRGKSRDWKQNVSVHSIYLTAYYRR